MASSTLPQSSSHMEQTAFPSSSHMEQTAFFTSPVADDMESGVWCPRPDVPASWAPKKQEPTKPGEKVDTDSFDFRVCLWSIPVEKLNTILRNVGISCDNTLWLDSLANYCAIHGTNCLELSN